MKILQVVEKSENNTVYISSDDFRELVRNKDINLNGVLVESKRISVKVDRLCPEGQVRSGELTM